MIVANLTDEEYYDLAKRLATTFDDYEWITELGVKAPKKYLYGICLTIWYRRQHDPENIRLVRRLLLTDTSCEDIDTITYNRNQNNTAMTTILNNYLSKLNINEMNL